MHPYQRTPAYKKSYVKDAAMRRERAREPYATNGGERKYFDTFLSAQAIAEGTAWTGTELDPATLNTLCVPSEGSDIDNRVGRQICIHALRIRGVISTAALPDQADVAQVPTLRLVLFQDMQTNGLQAQGEDLMAAPGAATAPLVVSTFQNLSNLGRFRVLKDKTIKLGMPYAGTDGTNTNSIIPGQNIPFKLNYKFKNPVLMRFNATNGGTVADIIDHSFHLIGSLSNATWAATISYQCRTAYTDK